MILGVVEYINQESKYGLARAENNEKFFFSLKYFGAAAAEVGDVIKFTPDDPQGQVQAGQQRYRAASKPWLIAKKFVAPQNTAGK
jgi:hypothetical protein